MNGALISVIVPIYNVEKYLRKCIDSIVNQTYKNLEIILVDDGSTDGCFEICDEYAPKDGRIKVIHKQNGGLSDARNAGIDIASGEYLAFIDSDDRVSKFYIQNLYYLIDRYDADMAITSIRRVYEGSKDKIYEKSINDEPVLIHTAKECIENLFRGGYYNVNAFAKIYKKELFSGIRFPKGQIYEDLATTPIIASKADRIAFCDLKDYFYLIRDNSIMTSKGSAKDLIIFDILDELEKYFRDDQDIVKSIEARKLRDAFMSFYKFKDNLDDLSRGALIKMDRIIKNNSAAVLKDKNSNTRDRIGVVIYNLLGLKAYLKFRTIALWARKNISK